MLDERTSIHKDVGQSHVQCVDVSGRVRRNGIVREARGCHSKGPDEGEGKHMEELSGVEYSVAQCQNTTPRTTTSDKQKEDSKH